MLKVLLTRRLSWFSMKNSALHQKMTTKHNWLLKTKIYYNRISIINIFPVNLWKSYVLTGHKTIYRKSSCFSIFPLRAAMKFAGDHLQNCWWLLLYRPTVIFLLRKSSSLYRVSNPNEILVNIPACCDNTKHTPQFYV